MSDSTIDTVDVAGRPTLVARRGTGSPVLYLHGLVADLHATFDPAGDWPGVAGGLSAEHEVVAPALPGWLGSSGAESLEGADDRAFHLADLLDTLGLDRVDVVGVSVGGWWAAELAVRHPSRVDRLALVAPLGLHVPGDAVPAAFGALAPRGIGGFGEARQLLFVNPDGDAALTALPDDMDRDAQLRWFSGLAGAARIGWKAPQFQSRGLARHLSRVGAPALLVWGAADKLLPPTHAAAWHAALPHAARVDIPGAGHAVAAERPAEVVAVVQPFLAAASHDG